MVTLIDDVLYPVYKQGAPVASDDLNKSNEITRAALNHIHAEVDGVLADYISGALKGATYTPYIAYGQLCFTNDKGLPNPEPYTLTAATFIPSVDALGNLSWSNQAGLDNPPTVNIKGPHGDGAATIEWKNVVGKPTSLPGYGITDAYTKSEMADIITGLLSQIEALELRMNVLESQLDGKQDTITISPNFPSGGKDGDIWLRVTGR